MLKKDPALPCERIYLNHLQRWATLPASFAISRGAMLRSAGGVSPSNRRWLNSFPYHAQSRVTQPQLYSRRSLCRLS